mgnify:CR=1 FL=1
MWLCHTWGESSKERPRFVFGLFDGDLFLKSDYVNLYNKTFDVEIDSTTLTDGSILEQLRALNNGESFNHYRPANYLAKNIQSISFSNESLDNFEKLFKLINKLF